MKKFSLKPLGNSCIDVLCKSAFLIGLLMTFGLAACSDDDDNAAAPVFPEKQNLICNAGDTREFTFTANTNWSLASSAIWCKFKTDGMEEFTLSGAAGTQTVTLMITDDNQKVDNISVAKLELTMGGQTIVIGEVTRSKVDYELTIYDADGNKLDETTDALLVGYNDFAKFSVKANFRFAATNLPGWIELEGGSLVGAVGQEVKGGLKIINNESREKYPVLASEDNVITFSDEEGKSFRSIKVRYEGMDPNIMILTLPSSYPTNWAVSLDGQTFTQKSSGGSTGDVTLHKRMPFTIKTLNDDYVFVYMEEWEGNIYLVEPEMLWMHCEGDKGKINLTVDAYTPFPGQSKERTGYVLAFLRADYEKIKDDLETTIVKDGEIVHKYEENNLLIAFTQKEVKDETGTKSFLIKKSGWEEVAPSKATNTAILGLLQGNYSISDSDVYTISANAGEYYVIYPLLSASEWGDFYVINSRDEDVTVVTEPGEDGDGMYMSITVPDPFKEDLIVVFKGSDMMFKKALVISPSTY